MQDHRIPLNARVRLRDGIDPALYKGFSRTGNEGWIRNHRYDPHGYPQVLIEWDRDHWAYNGVANCWTWEDHFDIIEGIMADKKPKPHKQQTDREEQARDLTAGFVKALFQTMGLSEQEVEEADEENVEVVEGDKHDDDEAEILDEAVKALKSSKAFIVISMQQDDSRGGLIHPACYQQAETEELALVCQAQLGHLVAMLQDGLIHSKLQSKQDE